MNKTHIYKWLYPYKLTLEIIDPFAAGLDDFGSIIRKFTRNN
jgi:hypothetical protein